MVLAQKQTHRTKEQEREPKSEATLIWAINLWQKRQEYTIGEKTASSVNGIGIDNKVLLFGTVNYIQYPVMNHNRAEYKKSMSKIFLEKFSAIK